MKVCVFGLWHLGSVITACLADLGFEVIGLDKNKDVINNLNKGVPPLYEPGLQDLTKSGIKKSKLKFTFSPEVAFKNIEYLWIAFDTPVDENDKADVSYLEHMITSVMKYFKDDLKIIISSQAPVGFTAKIEKIYNKKYHKNVYFVYSPENLRLGEAIKVFMNPDRIIIGIKEESHIEKFLPIFSKISNRLEWMKIESAEMTKHAINAFLATSVVFANELAILCESVGADMREVERGLKTEVRIGPKAYVRAGGPFGGGTLARDINFLKDLGKTYNKNVFLFDSVKKSNDYHKDWIKRKSLDLFKNLQNKKFGILGLTYKPNTDTLRRSSSIELCEWLFENGSVIKAFDPNIKDLPGELSKKIKLKNNIRDVIEDIDCIIVATEHSIFKELKESDIITLKNKVIIDPNGFLEKTIKNISDINYIIVGKKANETK